MKNSELQELLSQLSHHTPMRIGLEAFTEHARDYGGLSYPAFYAGRIIKSIKDDEKYGIRRIRPHKISMNDIDKLIEKPLRDGTVDKAQEIIKQIHYLVSWERNINHP